LLFASQQENSCCRQQQPSFGQAPFFDFRPANVRLSKVTGPTFNLDFRLTPYFDPFSQQCVSENSLEPREARGIQMGQCGWERGTDEECKDKDTPFSTRKKRSMLAGDHH
jgi:hypothetical protein